MADTPETSHPSYRWLKRMALGGMVAAANHASTPPLPADALKLPNAPEKTVYVGMDAQLKQRVPYLDSARGNQFLALLHGMPGIEVRSIQADGDPRALIYPEDPIIPLPGAHFREPAGAEAGSAQHGNSSAIRAQLQADGFAQIAPLGFDLDGGDVLYDAKRGLFLIGGTPDEVGARVEQFHRATGHYAIPIPMTQTYALHGEPSAGGQMVSNPVLFYHLDTFANILPKGELVIHPDATDAATIALLKRIYGPQLLTIGREEAERYITNFIASTDTDGQSHVLLPAISHHTPFDDHEAFNERLARRGYHVHSPETFGYCEPHQYAVDLFDRSSDFPARLLAVLNAMHDTAMPDRETLTCLAQEQALEVAEDQGRIVFRHTGTPTRYWALEGMMGEPFTEHARTEMTRAKEAFALHGLLRDGAITEEAIVTALQPELSSVACETMANLPAYRFTASAMDPATRSPFIQGNGGIDCMTLDVLKAPSPQQQIFSLLAHPNRSSLLLAQKIAKEAGFSFTQTGRAILQIDYPHGMRQTFDLTRDFAENQVSVATKALTHGRH